MEELGHYQNVERSPSPSVNVDGWFFSKGDPDASRATLRATFLEHFLRYLVSQRLLSRVIDCLNIQIITYKFTENQPKECT